MDKSIVSPFFDSRCTYKATLCVCVWTGLLVGSCTSC